MRLTTITLVERYCSAGDNLTIDHVMPAALGGEWKWENLVRPKIFHIA